MKNLRVHRVNFFEPDPKSVRCFAYDSSISRLAVSRADASIEIWDVAKNPYLEKVIPSISDASVETLCWCNGRLFSAGLYGYIFEYDLLTLTQKYQNLVSTGCPIWCMAVNRQKTCLAIGNEDGHVILHEFLSEGLDFHTKFDKQEGSVLCLDWHKEGHVIVTGSLDTIRVWNVDTGHVINRIIFGRAARNRPTVVWCISILSDMTIVSGDSCGKVSFWDGNTGTLSSSQTLHKDDILTLSVTEKEDEICTSGVDFVIQMFMQSHSDNMWLKSVKRIVHTHDVRAVKFLDTFLVSGGDDCNLVFTKYPPKTTVKYFPYCQMSYSDVASLASCILLRYPSYLEMWRIGASELGNVSHKLLQIKAKTNEVITCSTISSDGKWIAYSSQFQLRLFHINIGECSSDIPTISKISLPEEAPNCASIILFSSEPTRLVLYSKGMFFIIHCHMKLAEVQCTIKEDQESAGQTHLMELSSDSIYLATGSHNGSVVIYNLESQKTFCRLPQYKYQPTQLKFDPSSENVIVAYSDRKVVEYSLQREAYTNWTKNKMLVNLQEASYHPITSIVYSSDKLFLSDENCIYVFNKSEQLQPERKKAKHSENSSVGYGDDTYSTVTKYEHISRVHSLLDDLLVVQMSARHIEDVLPPPIYKKKYGT